MEVTIGYQIGNNPVQSWLTSETLSGTVANAANSDNILMTGSAIDNITVDRNDTFKFIYDVTLGSVSFKTTILLVADTSFRQQLVVRGTYDAIVEIPARYTIDAEEKVIRLNPDANDAADQETEIITEDGEIVHGIANTPSDENDIPFELLYAPGIDTTRHWNNRNPYVNYTRKTWEIGGGESSTGANRFYIFASDSGEMTIERAGNRTVEFVNGSSDSITLSDLDFEFQWNHGTWVKLWQQSGSQVVASGDTAEITLASAGAQTHTFNLDTS